MRRTRRKTISKIGSFILSAAMVAGGLTLSPMGTLEAQAAATAKNVNLNVSGSIAGLGSPSTIATDKWTGSKVYMGSTPNLWRVLDPSDNSSRMLLFADDIIQMGRYHEDYKNVTWVGSTIRSYLNGYDANQNIRNTDYSGTGSNFIENIFTETEIGAIATTSLDNTKTGGGTAGGTTSDKLFLLSLGDGGADQYGVENTSYGFVNNECRTKADGKETTAWWWLRSPGTNTKKVACVSYGGNVVSADYTGEGWNVNIINGVRPAFNLNLSSVLFSSASGLDKPQYLALTGNAPTNNTWKLTLIDTADNSFAAALPASGTAGGLVEVSVTTAGAGAVTYNQTSAMLVDESNTVVAYGKIGGIDANNKVFALPNTIAAGNYILKVFPEQVNGGNLTDYAGQVVSQSITIAAAVPTVFSVTVSPSTTSVQKGNTENFSAAVNGTNSPAQTVTWDVEGESSSGTSITDGTLTVGSDETATTLTIRATSTVDTNKSGTAAVTVTDVPVTYHTITTIASPANGGTISGGGQVADGGSTTLTASPNNGYQFSKWTVSGNQVSTLASYQISNITEDAAYSAVFEKKNESSQNESSQNESSGEEQQPSSNASSQNNYKNPLSWNYTLDNQNAQCTIEQQGPLCVKAFADAAKSIGYTELFSFNFAVKGADHLHHTSYDAKSGKFVLTLPEEERKPGCKMALIGIDQNGKTKVFYDIDTSDATITIDNLNITGYAFDVVYLAKLLK